MTGSTTLPNTGVIVSVRGSIIDIRFQSLLPPIHSLLHTGNNSEVSVEVLSQLDAQHVRCIALTPTQGIARGMTVQDSGGPLMAPVGQEFCPECLTYSAMPSTACQPLTFIGEASIGRHPH
jgi:F-type H+-transporting ATPase subunit beta